MSNYTCRLTQLTHHQAAEVRACAAAANLLAVDRGVTVVELFVRPATFRPIFQLHYDSLAGQSGRRQAAASVLRKLDRMIGPD